MIKNNDFLSSPLQGSGVRIKICCFITLYQMIQMIASQLVNFFMITAPPVDTRQPYCGFMYAQAYSNYLIICPLSLTSWYFFLAVHKGH
jgi:hypothetical protein